MNYVTYIYTRPRVSTRDVVVARLWTPNIALITRPPFVESSARYITVRIGRTIQSSVRTGALIQAFDG